LKRYNKHIFVCENKRPDEHPSGCCADKESKEIRAIFKSRLKELGISSMVRANAAGCLDACEHGVTIVVYPEQVWYGAATKADVEEIIQKHILNDQPVKRLMIKDKKFNKDANHH
jgi:(2Fe-2S) ferredoxin